MFRSLAGCGRRLPPRRPPRLPRRPPALAGVRRGEDCAAALLTMKNRRVRYAIDNTLAMLAQLDASFSDRTYRSIHVAGSNGKGTVCFTLARALQALGYRVGLFVSPHLYHLSERVQVNGVPISTAQIEAVVPYLLDVADKHDIPVSFFELVTLLAFKHFSDQQVDWAVFEVGLGGRLDSTNVIHPQVCVITSICLEHTRILGDSVEQIAREKCGIIKPKVPVVIGPEVPVPVVLECAKAVGAEVHQVQGPFPDCWEQNKAVVEAALRCALPLASGAAWPPEVLQALAQRPPGRFQSLHCFAKTGARVEVILDVAHNPGAMRNLQQVLRRHRPNKRYRVVLGLSNDKDHRSVIDCFVGFASALHLVEAKQQRATSVQVLEQFVQAACSEKLNAETAVLVDFEGAVGPTVAKVLQEMLAARHPQVQPAEEVLVVTGSFFIMEEARDAIYSVAARVTERES